MLMPMPMLMLMLLPATSVTSKTDDGASLPPPTVEAGRAGVARLLRAARPLFSQLRICRRAPASAAAPSNAAAGGTTAQPWY